MKTIRMSKEKLDKWLAALRGGEYKQIKGDLYDPGSGGYCCLGVLEHCLTGEVPDVGMGLPTKGWLEDNEIEFLVRVDEVSNDPVISAEPVGILGSTTAATLNDDGMPFAEIADMIEACTETY